MLETERAAAKTEAQRKALEAFRDQTTCPDCGGARLRPEARAVTVGDRPIEDVLALPITASRRFFEGLRFEPPLDQVGPPLTREIASRLAFLDRVGLGYLTLARGADTLSGGELQRVRLATQIGSGLVGVCYVLDEPTAGLHPRDANRLLASLKGLKDQGNSVLVVEHDEAIIRAADWLIDLGPGAGPDGGRVVALGPPHTLVASAAIGDRPLPHRGENGVPSSNPSDCSRSPGWIAVVGASDRNLKGVEARIPVGTLTCVTGVSGSGKSTLVHDVLARARPPGTREGRATARRLRTDRRARRCSTSSSRSTRPRSAAARARRRPPPPASSTRSARSSRGLARPSSAATPPAASASTSRGAGAKSCEGQGLRRVEMHFLPDLYVRCETCGGKRFNRQTLEVRFKGRSIGDVLEMRVDEARDFFDAQPKVSRGLDALHEAGLGYITLGQSSTTLSGGEAQRVKLAAELGRAATGRTLYILDEPTTGLHFADVERLLRVLHRLADLGNTVVVIEHNLDVIKTADWVIDLGPEGGDAGGRIVAMAPPRAVAERPRATPGITSSRCSVYNKEEGDPESLPQGREGLKDKDLINMLLSVTFYCPSLCLSRPREKLFGSPTLGRCNVEHRSSVMCRLAQPGRTFIVGLGIVIAEALGPGANSLDAGASAPAEFKVAYWFDRRDPLNTFRFQAYDLRKGEYTAAVDEWLRRMKTSYPRYEAYVKEVRAQSRSDLATAILNENLAVGGPTTGTGIRDDHGLGLVNLSSNRPIGYSSAYTGPSSSRSSLSFSNSNLFGRSSLGDSSQSLLGRPPGSGAYQPSPPTYLYPIPYPYPRPHP